MTKFKQKISLADVVLVVCLIVLAIAIGIRQWGQGKDDRLYIYRDNILIASYGLNRDIEIEVDDHNSLAIRNGKVAMVRADCPDKRCIKQGYSRSIPIICLPNHLVIEIKESESENKLILY